MQGLLGLGCTAEGSGLRAEVMARRTVVTHHAA